MAQLFLSDQLPFSVTSSNQVRLEQTRKDQVLNIYAESDSDSLPFNFGLLTTSFQVENISSAGYDLVVLNAHKYAADNRYYTHVNLRITYLSGIVCDVVFYLPNIIRYFTAAVRNKNQDVSKIELREELTSTYLAGFCTVNKATSYNIENSPSVWLN